MAPTKRKDALPTSLSPALDDLKSGRPASIVFESYQQLLLHRIHDGAAAASFENPEKARVAFDRLAQAAQLVAELAKEEKVRGQLGATPIPVDLCSFLKALNLYDPATESERHGLNECRLQILRAIGNLCYEHDTNRRSVIAAGFVPECVTCVHNVYSDRTLPRVVCGALLNVLPDDG